MPWIEKKKNDYLDAEVYGLVKRLTFETEEEIKPLQLLEHLPRITARQLENSLRRLSRRGKIVSHGNGWR